jgi:hypothetical protein
MLMEGAFLTAPMSVCPVKVTPSSSAVQRACVHRHTVDQLLLTNFSMCAIDDVGGLLVPMPQS